MRFKGANDSISSSRESTEKEREREREEVALSFSIWTLKCNDVMLGALVTIL